MTLRARILTARWTIVVTAVASLTCVGLMLPDHDGRALSHGQPPVTLHAQAKAEPASRPPRPQPAPPPASAAIAWSAGGSQPVPRSFLGFSTEYWTLPLYAPHMTLFERALSLVHVPGDAPEILRIGGDSADHTFWDPRMRRMPRWAFRLGPAWVKLTGRLVAQERLRLILDLNLVTGSSPAAARWARAAARYLPRRSIVGFEIGNEPDIYDHWEWAQQLAGSRMDSRLLPNRMPLGAYLTEFRSYAHALARAAPRVPLVGPALANPALDLNWLVALIAGARPGLGLISAHRYPYSACTPRSSPTYASIARILSEHGSAGLAHNVRPAVELAEHAGLPFRLTELNSVTCGGVRGVSDTFATSLWAPDALFELMTAGVDGVNVHVRQYAINAAFTVNRSGFHARPLFYGLLLFTRTIGAGASLVPVHVRAAPALHLKAWGVRLRAHLLHVLVIDKGSRPVRVRLELPARRPAVVERLLAPSVSAHSGITLAGQTLDSAGRWRGTLVRQIVPRLHRAYTVTLPQMSAALVTVTSATSPADGRRGFPATRSLRSSDGAPWKLRQASR